MTAASEGPDAVVLSELIEIDKGTQDAPEEIWTIEAILNLAAQYLPALPTGICVEQQTMNDEQWLQAAHNIHQSVAFRLLSPEDAILRPGRYARFHDESAITWLVGASLYGHSA